MGSVLIMPLDINSAVSELQRRGVNVANPAMPAPTAQPMQVQPGVQPPEDLSSPRDVERQLRLKQNKGQLAVQDAVNELKRRGVNLQLRTQPAVEAVQEVQANEAVENAQNQGDPEAFKNAWRQFFPGKPLPRTPDGKIDYAGGQDDLDVELDRKRKLEAAKVGSHNVKEVKTTRLDPATGKEQDILVRIDTLTGQKLGETVLSENPRALTESQSNAKMFSTRMQSNNDTLKSIEARGFDPTAFGTTVQSFLPNRFKTEDVQAYNAAKQNWIAATLRKESGAAISPKEYADANKQYFPQDGDAPAVVKQKQELRELAQSQMREAAGPGAGSAPAGAAAAQSIQGQPAAEAPVAVNSAAEAPPTAKFIRSPSGRVYRNPKYTGQ